MASVRKRKGTDKWIVTYTDQAGKRRQGGTFDRKKDADAERLRIEQEIERGVHTPARMSATFAEACDEWLKDCERRWRIGDRMSGNNLYKCRSIAKNNLIPVLGRRKLNEIDHDLLQDVVNQWSESFARSTVAEYASCLRLVFNVAVRKKWVKLHPLASLKLHIPGRMVKRTIPDKGEIERILLALRERYYRETESGHRMRVLAVVLAVFGGLRRGEVCGLQWENVDFDRNEIRIRHSLSRVDGLKDPKSKAGIRTIPMPSTVRRVLEWAAGQVKGDLTGHVVTTREGTPLTPSNVYWYWTATCKQADLTVLGKDGETLTPKYPFHALRHAAVSLLIEQGLQPFHIKSFIGHHSIRTTLDIYGHMFPDDMASKNAIEAAASQFTVAIESRKSYGGHNAAPRQISDKTPQVVDI
ncbi:MAG: site-specific integrase [Rhizobiales bacterium]|nr:site-specific integrase [Hyphomicrobiales bacterium]